MILSSNDSYFEIGNPINTGDYIMHDTNMDGWSLYWFTIGKTSNFVTSYRDLYWAQYMTMQPSIFSVTSADNNESLAFMFVSYVDGLEITKTTSFEFNSTFITTFVTIKNIMDDPIADLYCKFYNTIITLL